MYSDVFRMYPRARVGKPSDTIKIQRARCEYKRILAHEGSMTLRYKVPYTIQARYKQDTVEYRCIPDVATGYSQDTSKIQSNTDVSQMYPAMCGEKDARIRDLDTLIGTCQSLHVVCEPADGYEVLQCSGNVGGSCAARGARAAVLHVPPGRGDSR